MQMSSLIVLNTHTTDPVVRTFDYCLLHSSKCFTFPVSFGRAFCLCLTFPVSFGRALCLFDYCVTIMFWFQLDCSV